MTGLVRLRRRQVALHGTAMSKNQDMEHLECAGAMGIRGTRLAESSGELRFWDTDEAVFGADVELAVACGEGGDVEGG